MMKPHPYSKRLLEQWRGVPEPSLPRDTSRVIGDVVPGVMKKLGLSERYGEEEIARAWTQVVGHPLCVQAVPSKLQHRVLHIRMVQPTIHFVLEGMRDEILARLQQRFGKRIQGVKFVIR